MDSGEVINPRSLHDEVANRLTELITRGDLGPGERLNERVLAARFGISRTPLREAIKSLAAEGLVKVLPNRGAVVVTITRADVEDMFQLLGTLEEMAGKLACERATDADIAEIADLHESMRACHAAADMPAYFECKQRIHQKVVDCSGNRELAAAYRRLASRIRCPRFNSSFPPPRWDEVMEENDRILAALTKRDGKRLSRLLVADIAKRSKVIQDWLAAREVQVKSGATCLPAWADRSIGNRSSTGS